MHVYEWGGTEYVVGHSLENAIQQAILSWGENSQLSEEEDWKNKESWNQIHDSCLLSILIDGVIETQTATQWAELNGPGPLASIYGD